MNLAAIFAFLLAQGVCSEQVFQSPDGSRLSVIVCPRMATPEAAPEPDAKPAGRPV